MLNLMDARQELFCQAVLTLATVSPLDVAYIVVAAMKDTLSAVDQAIRWLYSNLFFLTTYKAK